MFSPFVGAALGEVQQDLVFQGVSFDRSLTRPSYAAVDGVVSKSFLSTPDINASIIRFWFLAPSVTGTFKAKADVGIATTSGSLLETNWYGYKATSFSDGTFSLIQPTHSGNIVGMSVTNGVTSFSTSWETPLNESFDSIILELVINWAVPISTSITFSSSGSFNNNLSTIFPSLETDFYLSTYNTSDPIWQYYGQYGTIYNKKENVQFAKAHIRLPATAMDIHGSTSSQVSASSATDIMAYGAMTLTYGDDGGLKNSVDNQTSVIQQEQGKTQQAVKEQGEKTQQTIKDETEKQTSAIGGFFDNLLGGIKDFFTGLFIPDEIATDAFTELLENKLGFIYQVPSIVVSFFTTLFGAFANGQASAITFPGWSYGEWTFLEPATISRSDYSAIFSVLDPILTIVGTILVVFAFCKGVQSFYERILGGGKE